MISVRADVAQSVSTAMTHNLLARDKIIRAVVCNIVELQPWVGLEGETDQGELVDTYVLGRAFADVEDAFVVVPARFARWTDFFEAFVAATAIARSGSSSEAPKVVVLSTTSSFQKDGLDPGSLTQALEQALTQFAGALMVLRPAWFFENMAWDADPDRETSEKSSTFDPLYRRFAMIATANINQVAATLCCNAGANECENTHSGSPNLSIPPRFQERNNELVTVLRELAAAHRSARA